MAKRGALEHPKVAALADALNMMDCCALGVLEALWHFVAKYHPDGDITSVSPRGICRSIRYTDDPAVLMDALVAARLVDNDNGRLTIHNWAQHADDATHSRLYRSLTCFATGERPKANKLGKPEKERLDSEWATHFEPTGSQTIANGTPAGSQTHTNGTPAGSQTMANGTPQDSNHILRGPAGVPPGSLPEPKPLPEPEPNPSAGGCGGLAVGHEASHPPGGSGGEDSRKGEETLDGIRSALMEVPSFAKSPPPESRLRDFIEDFADLGDKAILRHVRSARDWALDPKSRYAKAPDKPSDGLKFMRNWLEKELKASTRVEANGKHDPGEPDEGYRRLSYEELGRLTS